MKEGTVQAPRLRLFGRIMLAGLAASLPLLGSVWVLFLVYRILLRVGDAMVMFVLRCSSYLMGDPDAYLGWSIDFPGANFLRFLLPIFLVFCVGLAVLNRPGKIIAGKLDSVLRRVPVLSLVYTTLKQFVDALKGLGGERKFKSVVYVEYPSPGCRLIGFVTGNFHDSQSQKNVTSVFIPTSPNPITGFMVVVDDEKVEVSDMTVEQASKMIISAGLVTPDHLGGAKKVVKGEVASSATSVSEHGGDAAV